MKDTNINLKFKAMTNVNTVIESNETVVETVNKATQLDCNLDSILFDVEKVKSITPSNSEYEFDIFAYPNGEKLRVNSCSSRYSLIPNKEIFPEIETVLNNSGIEYTKQYSMYNNAKFYATYIITDKRFEYTIPNTEDTIQLQITVTHSYNGLCNYSINFGYFRLVCSNGLTIAVEEMKEFNLSIKGKHTESINISFKKLQEKLSYCLENAEQLTLSLTAKYSAMAKEQITYMDDRIIEVLNVAKITAIENNNFNTVDYIKDVINTEKHLFNDNVNDWLIYNGINSYIFNEDLNKKAPEKRVEMDSKVLQAILV